MKLSDSTRDSYPPGSADLSGLTKTLSARQQRAVASLLGVAIGDALGASNEFKPRGSFAPVTTLCGGGPFNLQPGAWTDDTSMTLCLAESLVERGGFDARDQMSRYLRWYREGYWSSVPGDCFDIGNRTATELSRFERDGVPYTPESDRSIAPNGSLMRLAPIPAYFQDDLEKAIHYAAESSKTTHAGELCVDACKLLAAITVGAYRGMTKDCLLDGSWLDAQVNFDIDGLTPAIRDIEEGCYLNKPHTQIKSSGYVVHSLEAALWCFAKSKTFLHGAMLAANLGDDTDTVAAIYGGLAGAFYALSPSSDEEEVLRLPETQDIMGTRPVSPVNFADLYQHMDRWFHRAPVGQRPTGVPLSWATNIVRAGDIVTLAKALVKGE